MGHIAMTTGRRCMFFSDITFAVSPLLAGTHGSEAADGGSGQVKGRAREEVKDGDLWGAAPP